METKHKCITELKAQLCTKRNRTRGTTGSQLRDATDRRARKGESYDYPNSGEEASPNCRSARNDEHVGIHAAATGRSGLFPREGEARRSERKSRALVPCGSRGVDSRPAANRQRVTAALSVAAGCQVSRLDRPTRTSFERVDAEPDVPSSLLGIRDVGRGRMVNSSVGADAQVPLPKRHNLTVRPIRQSSIAGRV